MSSFCVRRCVGTPRKVDAYIQPAFHSNEHRFDVTSKKMSFSSAADLLRASYQQQAARVLFTTDPLLSRYFSYKAVESSAKLAGSSNTASSFPCEVADEAFVCRACGLGLMAGAHNTTLRVRSLKRGSTRRRRDSRNQRRRLTTVLTSKRQTQTCSPSNSNILSKLNENTIQKQYRSNYRRLIRVTDGEAKNAVIYTCGFCATKTKFKGSLVARAEKRQRSSGQQGENVKKLPGVYREGKLASSSSPVSHSFTKKDAIRSHPHLASKPFSHPSSSQMHQGISKDEEFIALTSSLPNSDPSLDKKAAAFVTVTEKEVSVPAVERSLKKKKKNSLGKPQSSKSALMNFLSSLND